MNLIEAAKEVVSRWDTPSWKDVPATAEYINRLRTAIEAAETTPKIPKNELPERIYLQISDDPDDEWYGEVVWREVTWSHDNIHSNDLVFIRQDLIPAAPAVTEGWQLVPKEPTDAMLAAYNKVSEWLDSNKGTRYKIQAAYDKALGEPHYKSMLAAAPKFGEK